MTLDADVVVVGAGNAALCAALAARERGARTIVLEKATREERGGNTYFSGGAFRFPYTGIDDVAQLMPELSEQERAEVDVGSYPVAAMRDDLVRVTGGRADPGLVDTLVDGAFPTMRWMHDSLGVRWVLLYGRQAYRVGGLLRFWGGLIVEAVGGGVGLSDALFAACEAQGVEVRYGTKAVALLTDERSGALRGVRAAGPEGRHDVTSSAVVLASGGFEANTEMRARYLGPGWEAAKVRGTRHNVGDGLRIALEAGAQSAGQWSGAHAVAWDLNAPPTGNRRIGDLYQKHSYPLGLIVNQRGERFVDEGADLRNYTYAKYGREILRQPGGVAFQLFDQRAVPLLRDEYRIREVTREEAATVGELADRLGIDRDGLERTVEAYNAACRPGEFNPAERDGLSTRDIDPPKSNWALPLSEAPFVGFAVTCGITFTFGGVRIDPRRASVLDTEDRVIPGLFAAGELVGGLFYDNYAGGSGLMAGAVFGRIAGAAAADAALGG
ncbi:MAG: FAD-dependent tricarballylate dehydrogenase TcuA [Chloroflexi bacterium]|nr:FAD-dependent tricarballylate dehydrogenase TcuA [Chloroflexota bacterium]